MFILAMFIPAWAHMSAEDHGISDMHWNERSSGYETDPPSNPATCSPKVPRKEGSLINVTGHLTLSQPLVFRTLGRYVFVVCKTFPFHSLVISLEI